MVSGLKFFIQEIMKNELKLNRKRVRERGIEKICGKL